MMCKNNHEFPKSMRTVSLDHQSRLGNRSKSVFFRIVRQLDVDAEKRSETRHATSMSTSPEAKQTPSCAQQPPLSRHPPDVPRSSTSPGVAAPFNPGHLLPSPGSHMFGSQVKVNEGHASKTLFHHGSKLEDGRDKGGAGQWRQSPSPGSSGTVIAVGNPALGTMGIARIAPGQPGPVSSSDKSSTQQPPGVPVVVTIAKTGLHSGGTTIIQHSHGQRQQQSGSGHSGGAGAPVSAPGPGVGIFRLQDLPEVNAKYPYFLGPHLFGTGGLSPSQLLSTSPASNNSGSVAAPPPLSGLKTTSVNSVAGKICDTS